MGLNKYTPGESGNISIGQIPRVRLTATNDAKKCFEGRIIGVKALNAFAVYDEGCEAHSGEAPLEDDIIPFGDVDLFDGKRVVIKTGIVYVYYIDGEVIDLTP